MKYLIILLVVLVSSCNNIERQKQAISTVEQWIGKEMVFPENALFTIQGIDTLHKESVCKNRYTIINYIDSSGCTSCKLQLSQWSTFIQEIKSVSHEKIEVYLILYPKNEQEIINASKIHNYQYPIWIDNTDSFNRRNSLPKEAEYQTFLLNSNNEVIVLGNPVHNSKVKELYFNIIQGKDVQPNATNSAIQTSISIDKTSVPLGKFKWQKEQKASFILKNVGSKPLLIEDVNTSCGCTTVAYSKEPAQPGKEIKLDVTYKADHPEHFNKTISVHCNTEVSPIRLTISGNAK